MNAMKEMHEALLAPFSKHVIKWRAGDISADGTLARALAYIEARDVMDRLDEVLGPGNWEDEYQVTRMSDKRAIVTCRITLHHDGRSITKSDGTDVDLESSEGFELGKGSISEAFKRAAVKWGVGRYLYRLEAPWMPVNSRGYLEYAPTLPDWAVPENERGQKDDEPPSNVAPLPTQAEKTSKDAETSSHKEKVADLSGQVASYLQKVAKSVNIPGLVTAFTTAEQHFGADGGAKMRSAVVERFSALADSGDQAILVNLDKYAAQIFDEHRLLVFKETIQKRLSDPHKEAA